MSFCATVDAQIYNLLFSQLFYIVSRARIIRQLKRYKYDLISILTYFKRIFVLEHNLNMIKRDLHSWIVINPTTWIMAYK